MALHTNGTGMARTSPLWNTPRSLSKLRLDSDSVSDVHKGGQGEQTTVGLGRGGLVSGEIGQSV